MPIPVIIVQPPLVQLNGPYPSGAYLAAFFRGLAREFAPTAADFSATAESLPSMVSEAIPDAASQAVRALSGRTVDPERVLWIDASNGFFRHVFSRSGLTRLFSLSRAEALARADRAEADGNAEVAFQLRRFVSTEASWVSWIDGLVSILSAGDRELCHAFIRSPYAPRGARMDSFLSGLDGEPTPDDARLLATLALEDLSDFIVAAFDSEFSLIRYAESLASSERSFARVESALARPLVAHFIEPYAETLWDTLDRGVLEPAAETGESFLLCLSVPFPGCLVGALALARSARARYGNRAVISLGGGYVNTELRGTVTERLSEYVDILSFDRGFSGYAALLAPFPGHPATPAKSVAPSAATSAIAATSAVAATSASPGPFRLYAQAGYERYEARVTETIVPDYRDIDFSRYPRLADTPNPMHRLWSDGAWIKAFLAHGCYWHRCSFCDVSLDYIAGYRQVAVKRLYAGLRAQALSRGVRGVHLVDEAAPPRALRDFAFENLLAAGAPASAGGAPDDAPDGAGLLSFWGNIRFERTFSRDLADFLSAGGLVGVSGGIEIASAEGFKSVDKGIDLENLVACCAAFKEAGILVHAYLIYGYWNESAQGVVDAMETMRQLFAAGLVDSAFWHKFVLTRHSRVYGEWLSGKHHGALVPVDESGDFADNDLRFEGEGDSDRYGAPLDAALQAWMAGDSLEQSVRSWFPFPMPSPRAPKDLVDGYIARYEEKRDHERSRPCDPEARYWWCASCPVVVSSGAPGKAGAVILLWWHLGEEVRLELDRSLVGALFSGLGFASSDGGVNGAADSIALGSLPRAVFKRLRAAGLSKIAPL